MDGWMKERGPALGQTYYSAADAVMTSRLRSLLINLKDLELTVETNDEFSRERLEIVNRFKNIQVDRLLGNHRQFDFTDIRDKFGSKPIGNEI